MSAPKEEAAERGCVYCGTKWVIDMSMQMIAGGGRSYGPFCPRGMGPNHGAQSCADMFVAANPTWWVGMPA